ncbi:hypothetical protein EJ05DRAFT_473754 [Pseudovirgaria hyperparasitica]|uniref:Uncharacterized protein n=1 Tax=Pseudovirgaria hyperparasitica TaxID=470096 RepID=A0A6A6WER9_9PEZI|nr:uncharacterized protein EJ05DRAFT_473754 [Pseudovirgaria hyperparasitica]KAF2761213.1 hypothetical protein EJ05DRAFT_473754 [Pseudovirgaria hyperparasitica]
MAEPMSPLPSAAINTTVPETPAGEETWHDPPSSPFVECVDQENTMQSLDLLERKTAQRVVSQSITPSRQSPKKVLQPIENLPEPEAVQATPRPFAKEQSPVKPTPSRSVSRRRSPVKRSASPPAEQLRDNEGLTVAARNWEYMQADILGSDEIDYDETMDNTCFSTFSEVPNVDMTAFSKMRRSPTKQLFDQCLSTPRPGSQRSPGTVRRHGEGRSPSPTPRGNRSLVIDASDTTNLLLDFTEQIQQFSTARSQMSPNKMSPVKSQTESNLLHYINGQRSPGKSTRPPATPSGNNRNILNLLDFELPPPATPRSLPTITVRELESVKSNLTAQISQLTASLSGKDATIESLTKALNDAERRVGEAKESVREERSAREHAENEKATWEKKGHEVENVLRSIKKEIMESEKEREELFQKVEAAERRADEAEAKASDAHAKTLEAETKLVDASVFVAADETSSSPRYTAEEVQRQIDEKVETLCRELHMVYKKKHETKVSALKKSYEAKSEKKLAELQRKLSEQQKQIDELQVGKDATFSGVLPTDLPTAQHAADMKRIDSQKAEIEEHKARLAGVSEEMRTMREEQKRLMQELEQERIEKGELVAAAEQLMTLQAEQPQVVEDFRKSVNSKPSGLRAPGGSRIGKIGAPSGSGKSRMMSNIERMGGGM